MLRIASFIVFACSRNEFVVLVLQVHGTEEGGTEEESGFGDGEEGCSLAFEVEEGDGALFRSCVGSAETRTKWAIMKALMTRSGDQNIAS